MTVLSLFDGISCGRVALEKAGIKVDTYYASEIDTKAIRIAKKNYPDIIEIGDVRNVRYADGVLYTDSGNYDVPTVDLFIGGSPCTNFSHIGYGNGMVSGETEILSLEQYLKFKSDGAVFEGQSYLFWEYVRILREVSPKHFLLENVDMIPKWRNIITEAMGVEGVKINSSLLTAQNRPRIYWTDAGDNLPVPEDKGITIDDILDAEAPITDVAYTVTVQKSLPELVKKYGYIPDRFNAYNSSAIKDKARALSRGSMVTSSCATLMFVAGYYHSVKNGMITLRKVDGSIIGTYPTKLKDGYYNLRKLSLTEMERLQTLPEGYTTIENIGEQKRGETIGNGWSVDVISHIFKFLFRNECG